MEARNTQTVTRQSPFNESTPGDGDGSLSRGRLDILLEANAAIAREKTMYGSEREKREAEMMSNPINSEKAFAYLGLLLGVFPPMALFIRALAAGMDKEAQIWIVGILAIVMLLSAIVGYLAGILVGRTVRRVETRSWSFQLLTTPLIGLLWGLTAGAAGGIIIFIIGAVFGAMLGAAVGFVALPAFAVLHRLFKRGDLIEMKHFLPLAFGVTLTICSFILGV